MAQESSAVIKYEAGELKAAEDNVSLVWGAGNCTKEVRTQIARITLAYGLDPFLKHIEILGGKPYITHAGLLHFAHGTKRLGAIICRPLNNDEREGLKGEMKEREVWRCAEIQIDMGDKFGIVVLKGYSKAGGPGEGSSVANGYHTYAVAEKRAINRTLRLAFSIGIPSSEEMGAEQYDLPMGEGQLQETKTQDGKTSRVEAKLRKVSPNEKPPEGETIETTATKPEEPTVTPPAPAEQAAAPAAPASPEQEEMAHLRAKLAAQLHPAEGARLNKARSMIFNKQVLGSRPLDKLTLDELHLALQTLGTKAWAGGGGQ